MNIYGVIMAGGGGTRFWPLSRKDNPKQLLNLSGKEVMVNETVNRLNMVAEKDNIYIVTNCSQVEKMKQTVKGKVNFENILSEPSARNTSACIGYSAIKILKERGDGVLIVTPSDAYIKDEKEYARILEVGVKKAQESDSILTIGIKPTFPSTGYGYINFGEAEGQVKPVLRFVEKPNKELAEEYVKSGKFVWNSGVFIFKASVIIEKIKECIREVYDKLKIIGDAIGCENEKQVLEEVYPQIPSISIDYGVMEKSSGIAVVPGDFGWNDVGSFDMMNVLHEGDKDGNISLGKDNILVDCKNTTVISNGKTVALIGLDDLVVVETADAILVCKKDKAQDVKKVVDIIKEQGRNELL